MNAYDLFDSIGIIVDAKLAQLNSNITVVATVTDISKRDQGIYSVTYDSAVFTANGADSSLKLGDLVYVGIPDKNYTNAYIICKKVQEEKLVKITAPFEGFTKELNIIPDESEYIINNENKNIMLTWEGSEYCPFINYNNFNNLGLSLKVKLDMANINLPYGIRVIIETQEQINKQILKFRHALDLDINTILNGNYVPNSEIVIEKLFDINDIENITGLYAEVYSTTENVNITFSDINLWFGSLISDFDREELVLYTKEDTNYSSDNNNINRKIYLRWVHKEDDEFKVVTSLTQDNIPPEASISWKHNGEDITSAKDKWVLEVSSLNPYKDIEEYSATIIYNTIEAETALQYMGALNFINTSENKDIFSKNSKIKLTAPRTSFDNVYHPDGTILDFELTDNPEDYKVTLEVPDKNISPFLRPKDTSIKYQTRFLIPNNHTNLGLGIQKSDQVMWVEKTSDDTNYKIIESVDDAVTPDNYQDYWITYSIGEFYSPLKNNNTITYEIIAFYNGKEIERFTRTLDISFRRSGICKTDYVLVPTITNEVGLPTRSIKMTNGILNIRMSLCNSDGIEEEITRNIEWEWYGRNQEDIPKLQIQQFDENKRSCRIVSNITKEDLTTHNFNYVLKATYNAYKNNIVRFSVSCLIPIGINTSLTDQDNYIIEYFGGPTQIVYDSNGGNPNFYSTDYKLFTSDKNLYGHGSIENATIISWTLKTPALGSQAGLYPHLEKRSNKYYLVAPSLYTKDADTGCVLEGRYGEQIMWIQPLVSWQSTSFSSYINDWSGSLKIDEAENTIMSARLGAGRKNDDGTFSGVLLGDWQEKIEDKTITTTGIYGYDKGAQSYALKEDGTAFFGKNGEGRIEFDGNYGIIESANFDGTLEQPENCSQGSHWNLTTGKLVAKDGFFKGEISAITGNIGDWQIQKVGLTNINKTIFISNYDKINLVYNLPASLIIINGMEAAFNNDNNQLYNYLIQNGFVLKLDSTYYEKETCTILKSLFDLNNSLYNGTREQIKELLQEYVQTLDLSELINNENLSAYWTESILFDSFQGSLALNTFKAPYPFGENAQLIERVFYGKFTEEEYSDTDDNGVPKVDFGLEARGEKGQESTYYKFNRNLTDLIITGFAQQTTIKCDTTSITDNFVNIKIYNLSDKTVELTKKAIGVYSKVASSNTVYGPLSIVIEGNIQLYDDFLYISVGSIRQTKFKKIWCGKDVKWDFTTASSALNNPQKSYFQHLSVFGNELEILRLPPLSGTITPDFFHGCNNVRTPIILFDGKQVSGKTIIFKDVTWDPDTSSYLFGQMKQVPYYLLQQEVFKNYCDCFGSQDYTTIDLNSKKVYVLPSLGDIEQLMGKYYTKDGLENIIIGAGEVPQDKISPISPSDFMITSTGKIIVQGIEFNV